MIPVLETLKEIFSAGNKVAASFEFLYRESV